MIRVGLIFCPEGTKRTPRESDRNQIQKRNDEISEEINDKWFLDQERSRDEQIGRFFFNSELLAKLKIWS